FGFYGDSCTGVDVGNEETDVIYLLAKIDRLIATSGSGQKATVKVTAILGDYLVLLCFATKSTLGISNLNNFEVSK
ncbi:MAG: hypothetical protein O4752_07775, partial [Trichodesmium sp. St4_bin8_1]|nr:hypothetical protein [Trichodesmium sp. St4_bin8_1]